MVPGLTRTRELKLNENLDISKPGGENPRIDELGGWTQTTNGRVLYIMG